MRLMALCFALSSSLFGAALVEDEIKTLPNPELVTLAKDMGKLCEFVARNHVSFQYGSEYKIVQNLSYRKNRKRQIGELDIVVFSKKTGLAVHLYEVKCQADEKNAYKKAQLQLNRFKTNVERCLRSPEKNGLHITGDQEYPCELFEHLEYDVLMPHIDIEMPSMAMHFPMDLSQIYDLQNTLRKRLRLDAPRHSFR